MLTDSLYEFQSSILDGQTLSRALTQLRADVLWYAGPTWHYDKFITNALLAGIKQIRKAEKKGKPEMLLRLLTMKELVERVCGFDMGSDEELAEGLQLASNGTRYKLKCVTAEELKVMGAAPLDETDARELPKYNVAAESELANTEISNVPEDDSKVHLLTLIGKRTNVLDLCGRPYQPAC